MNQLLRSISFSGFFLKRIPLGLLLLMMVGESWGQVTILSENFGTTTTLPTGWTAISPWAGTTGTASTAYTGASGNTNAIFNNTGANGVNATLTYSNSLSTIGYTSITVLWGGRATGTFSQTVGFEWSSDGTTWNSVSYTQVAANATWALVNGGTRISLPSGAEGVANLRFRWSVTVNNNGNYRIDDFTVQGTSCSLPTINTQPSSPSAVCNSYTGDIGLTASGTITGYQWQYSANGSTGWANVTNNTPTGATYTNQTTATLSVASLTSTGYYRCLVSNGGCSATSNRVDVIVNTPPVIGTEPSNPSASCTPFSGSLTVAMSAGTNLTYDWQYSADGSNGWASVANNIPNTGATYTSANTASLSIAGLTQTYYYRCVISNSGCTSVTTNPVTITYNGIAAPVATAATVIGSAVFTANWNTVTGATGYFVDLYQFAANTTVANWTFPTNGTVLSPPTSFSSNNSTQALSTNATGAIISLSGQTGQTTFAPSLDGWDAGSNSKNWQISLNTIGFNSILLSSKQRSSNTGPRDFKIQYRIGAGAWTDLGASITVANNFTTGVVSNVSLPAACNNQSSISIRWIMTSNTAVNAGTVATTGTSSIDDILISGAAVSYVSGWQNVSTTDNFLEVTGLSSNTTYYYVVRATNGTCTSSNSNEISITTSSPCTPSASITSFAPASGPAGTRVTITGTGFTGATAVKFGTVNASSFTVVNSTTIIAVVPVDAPDDKIRVTVSSCDAVSASNFDYLAQSGCGTTGSTASDLFISKLYDAASGSLSYIQIFNATGASVNLSAYTLRIITGSNTITDYSLSGTLANNTVFIVSVGTSSTTCSNVSPDLSFPSGSGFNGNDQIYLRKSGADIDYVPNPNYGGAPAPGFTQIRNANAPAPTTIYDASQWTNLSYELCTDFEKAPYSTSSATITITTQPSDINDCGSASVTFTVNATSSAPPPTYLWKYNDPSSMTGWANASTISITGLTVTNTSANTLTISGNLSDILNYQFYCELGESSCTQNTNAVQYTYTSLPVFRSKANGNWSTVSIWEMSNSTSGPWSNACSYPKASNSTQIIIQSGTTVTLDIDGDADLLTVESNAILQTSSDGNSQLTVLNSNTGADFIVNGTYIDNSNATNSLSLTAPATWQLGSAATLIKTNNSSSLVYRDRYETGMVNIPATANWIIRYLGADVTFTTTGGTYYPNLTFESNAGAWSPATTSSSRFSGSLAFATVKGNLDIGGTGSGTVVVYNENVNATALQILGNLIVRPGNTLTNAGNSTTTPQSGTGFEVKGNVSVEGTLTINGISGNTGTLTMSGTSPQSIAGSGTYNLYSLTVNNTGAIGATCGVTLNRALSMDGVLTLTNGLINTTSTNILSLTANATCPSGGTDVAFVNGPMRKAGTAAFNFPVGKLVGSTGYYGMIGISAPATATTFEALFYRANANNLGPSESPLLRVSYCEYWDLVRVAGFENVIVTLSWTNKSACNLTYINNSNFVMVANLDGGIWKTIFGTNRTGSPSAGTVTAINLPYQYQQFALGTTNLNEAPLPLNLNTFNAKPKQTAIQLDWSVGNNHQQQQYILERGANAQTFETITTVSAKQGTTAADYVYDDAKPLNGWNYYRLRAIDKEGKSNSSSIIKVWWGKGVTVNILPNPATEKIVINLSEPSSIKEIQIVNAMGQVMRRLTTVQFLNEVNISSMQAGIYYIRFLGENGLTTRSFVKQ